jgi:hypothetical protein
MWVHGVTKKPVQAVLILAVAVQEPLAQQMQNADIVFQQIIHYVHIVTLIDHGYALIRLNGDVTQTILALLDGLIAAQILLLLVLGLHAT